MKLPITSIIFDDRQRLDLGDIDGLCDSLTRLGQLQAVLVEPLPDLKSYRLVDGGRRTTAALKLGWTYIEVMLTDTLSDLQRQEMELEANLKRKDLTWQERCLTWLRLHRLKGKNDKSWTLAKMAELVGVSNVSEVLSLAKILEQTREQDTPWKKELWAQPGLIAAYQHCCFRNEQMAYDEMMRRKQRVRIELGQEKPPKGESQLLKPTDEDDDKPVTTSNEPRKIKLYNRMPEKGECKYALVLEATANNLETLPAYLPDNGCAILWFADFFEWNEANKYYTRDFYSTGFPLIWNRMKGDTTQTPFMESTRYGLFIAMPSWTNPRPQNPISNVITAAPQMGLDVVTWSLDAMCDRERDELIWCPNDDCILEVMTCYHTPVGLMKSDTLEQLKSKYQLMYRNVEFV